MRDSNGSSTGRELSRMAGFVLMFLRSLLTYEDILRRTYGYMALPWHTSATCSSRLFASVTSL